MLNSTIPLDDVLAFNNTHYLGGCFLTSIQNRTYSFIKGAFGLPPPQYGHPLYTSVKPQNAAYLIRQIHTGQVYVGSSNRIGSRVANHRLKFRARSHENVHLNKMLQTQCVSDFELVVFFTDTRNQAYELEQLFVDRYKNTGLLLNIAHDVRAPLKGASPSASTRAKIGEAMRKRWQSILPNQEPKAAPLPLGSAQASARISAARKASEAAMAQTAAMQARKRRPIHVNGTDYESVTVAEAHTGLSQTYLRQQARSSDSNVYFLKEATSPLSGRTMSLEQRKKLSEARKSSSAAQLQFEAAQALQRKKILLNGVLYNSVTEAVRQTGISETTIHRQLRRAGSKNSDGPYVLNYHRLRDPVPPLKE